ncbi:hypothetical protein [Pseudomonas gingeri]|uniref:Uncharacterized protein n=1 Tax=Pseudomonas gingeri TaxID=117681 RepID=A0A7Y8BMM5_9PSED|nr:hypothetical protein [Pseudomonas gingeri]NWB49541.1 hypothetical protein [Pseudomonas gingeri]
MISSLQRLLLEKYDPTNALLLEPTPTPVQKATKSKKMNVVMSSDKYSDDEITKALTAFNLKLQETPKGSIGRELISSSFQLLATVNGIRRGSWVIMTDTGVLI